MKLKNSVSIVTGGARGIGWAIAFAFIREGSKVAIVDIEAKEKMETVKKDLEKMGGEALFLSCDITKFSDVEQMVETVFQSFGRIDILVNNAGIIRRGTIETVAQEDWDRVIEVNLKGTFNCSKAVVEIMKRQGCGKIINISSIAGKLGDITSAPGYASSKAGIDALTKTLAMQLAKYHINVNAVSPHAIETEMSRQWSEEKRREVIASIPLGRLGKPEDVAEAVLFLASEEASFITGEILDVNGGCLMD
jgi:3-oxoacyl-[acyl-carrier protein] reductase